MESRCFAIGDIHGFRHSLEALISVLVSEAGMGASDHLVFLGDYVDRGPDDDGVLKLVMQLERTRPNTIALLGNHDSWRFNSYGDEPEIALWLRQRPCYHRWKNYFFSHAPVYRLPSPEILDRIPKIYWGGFRTFNDAVQAHYDFINPFQGFDQNELLHEDGVIGVCGHVHNKEVVIFPKHYIGIDTGAGFGGKLSAIELPSNRVFSVPELA